MTLDQYAYLKRESLDQLNNRLFMARQRLGDPKVKQPSKAGLITAIHEIKKVIEEKEKADAKEVQQNAAERR